MNKIRIALFSFLIFIFCANISLADEQYSKVYIFGDSLSDSGNFSSIVGPLPNPPYYQNRISNGPVMVEILASLLGTNAMPSLHLIGTEKGTNYAFVGARAFGTKPFDLDSQINLFLANHGGVAADDNLYIVFIGGDDLRDARNDQNGLADQIIDDALNSVLQNIRKLIEAGAENFMVMNSPDIGKIPESRVLAVLTGDVGIIERASHYSGIFNKELFHRLDKLKENYDVDIAKVDIDDMLNEVLNNGLKFGFSNTIDACYSFISESFNDRCNYGLNFDKFVFFDEIHPTARMHSLVANVIFNNIND